MLENLLASSRPGQPQTYQQASGTSYGATSAFGAICGDANSFESVSNNPGAVDFPEEDLHQPRMTRRDQLRATVQYMPRLKAVLPLAVIPLATLCLFYRPMAAEAATEKPWLPLVAFLLALAALVPCGAWAVEFLEDLVISHDSEKMGVVVNVVFEHLPAIAFSLWILIWREHRSICWIKPMLLGCVLFHLLVVLGGSVLAAPQPEEQFGASFGVSTWTTFSTGLIVSCAVFMIPTVYAQTITMPDLNYILQKKKVSPQVAMEDQNSKLLFISRALSVAVVLVYAVYLIMAFHSHTNYYTSAGNPNSPSTLSYALQYVESVRRAQQGNGHIVVGQRFSTALAGTCAAALCCLSAALCYVVVHCLPAVVSGTALSLPFILVVLLPVVFEGGGLGAALLMSSAGRLDIGASISFSGIVHLFLCVLPSIVLIAWAAGAPLELSLHPFLACTCFIAVLVVAQMVLVNRVRWLEGAMLVGLYVLVGCVCLLGGWHLCYWTEKTRCVNGKC